MLTAIISYKGHYNIDNILVNQIGLKKTGSSYTFIHNNQKLASVQHDEGGKKLSFSFSPGLKMNQYENIHFAILQTVDAVNGSIEDSGSLLGYLQNGEGAYIVSNWNEWALFLQKARLKSLEGQKVSIFDETDAELASGLLTDYVLEINDEGYYRISECTVITLVGEKKYTSASLKVEPTNEW